MKTRKEIPDYGEQGRRKEQTQSDNKITGYVFVAGVLIVFGIIFYAIITHGNN